MNNENINEETQEVLNNVEQEPVGNEVKEEEVKVEQEVQAEPQTEQEVQVEEIEDENPNKIKQELVYGEIQLTDRNIFLEGIQITNKHTIEKEGDRSTITVYDIEDKDLRKLRNEIASNKAKYHSARAAKNTGTVVKGVSKGLFGGIKAFAGGVKNSFKDEMKKLY